MSPNNVGELEARTRASSALIDIGTSGLHRARWSAEGLARERDMMAGMRLPCGLLLLSLVGGCGGQKTSGQLDAGTGADADADQDGPDVGSSQGDAEASGGDSDATDDGGFTCFSLFHACSVTAECCGPYRCLNITGQPACQEEGPTQDAAAMGADGAVDSPSDTDGADAASDGGDAAACFPLFHACTAGTDCCAPYRCLNITGQPACQLEGPATDGP